MCSCVAAVEALLVDQADGVRSSAVEKSPLVVFVLVLRLHLLLHQLVALPQSRVLDPFNLQTATFSTSFNILFIILCDCDVLDSDAVLILSANLLAFT